MADNREIPPFDIRIRYDAERNEAQVIYYWRNEDATKSFVGRTWLKLPKYLDLLERMDIGRLLSKSTGALGTKFRASNPEYVKSLIDAGEDED